MATDPRGGLTPYKVARCEFCGGTVEYRRTADPFEDEWHCTGCPSRGSVSWSREFGERAAHAARTR